MPASSLVSLVATMIWESVYTVAVTALAAVGLLFLFAVRIPPNWIILPSKLKARRKEGEETEAETKLVAKKDPGKALAQNVKFVMRLKKKMRRFKEKKDMEKARREKISSFFETEDGQTFVDCRSSLEPSEPVIPTTKVPNK